MTTTTSIIPLGVTEATSTPDVVVEDGAAVTVGISSVNSLEYPSQPIQILKVTPDGTSLLGTLGINKKTEQVFGPVTFRVYRPQLAVAFTVYTEA